MTGTTTPGTPTEVQNGSVRAPDGPPVPTDQEQFDAVVERDVNIVLKVLAGVAIFAALVMSTIALVVSSGKSDSPKSAAAVPATAATPQAKAPAVVAPARDVAVKLVDFKVLPSAPVGAAGRVAFRVRNSGNTTHELVVLRTNSPASSLPLKGGRADEVGNVGETGDLKVGATKTISLKLAAGHYALVCNLPGHYNLGQHTDFTVR
jgi:uncharacterized cupredoxin-like copper-binding protein